jgi:hypothetical protein
VLMTERGRMAMVVHRATLDEGDDELAYWLSRPVAERVEAVEVLRRRVFGEADGVRPGLSRVRRVVHRA